MNNEITNNKVKNIVNSENFLNNTTTSPINNNGIVYNGLARITYMNGKKKVKSMIVKNNGTELLFKYLTQCVCGSNVSDNMPKYLELGNISGEGSTKLYRPSTSIRCDLTSKYLTNVLLNELDGELIKYAACFTSIVPGSIIHGGNGPVNALRLYNDYYNEDNLSLLALIEVASDDAIAVEESIKKYSLLIEWYMYFTNKKSEASAT